jgi:hypothetical protein
MLKNRISLNNMNSILNTKTESSVIKSEILIDQKVYVPRYKKSINKLEFNQSKRQMKLNMNIVSNALKKQG